MGRLEELDQLLGEFLEKLDNAGKAVYGNAKVTTETVKLKGEITKAKDEIKDA